MLSDRDLVAGVLDGDSDAADLFVIRFSRFVWAILIRHLRLTECAAEELYQQVFVHLWEDDYRRLANWSGDGDFVAYLGPIVRHLAADARRRDPGRYEACAPPRSDGGEPLDERAADEPSPEELAEIREQRAIVARVLERFPEPDRELYRLRFERELSYREIATSLGLTVNATGVRLARLTSRLVAAVLAELSLPAGGPQVREVRSPGPGASGR